ncbi:MAG: FkbM family methyltransferase [Bacteroidetes bacterium]|nr:MAG: FkbM family methyltransferase [Bacteroidota bacterium]
MAIPSKLKEQLKAWVKQLPIAFTKNQRYDRQTQAVLRRVCRPDSNCVDVGCHKGEVLDLFLRYAPQGVHFGFEPLPDLFAALQQRYGDRCRLFEIALSDTPGQSTFNYVLTNPSYSGLRRRRYDHQNERDTTITVRTELLDKLLPEELPIRFVKIDVEGAEYQVLRGARRTLQRHRPYVVFEHGLGGADCYGTTPAQVYDLLQGECRLQVSTMARWLRGQPPLTKEAFERLFYEGREYYFLAYPEE